jgi:tetratricopeptide (TPR) repeat protein
MALFGRNAYDRNRLLEQAQSARNRGRRKRAIALYQRILVVDPADQVVHRKIAPLLARSKRLPEAWDSYRRVAGQLQRQGFVDQAIGVYREASSWLWRERKLWLSPAGPRARDPADRVRAELPARRTAGARGRARQSEAAAALARPAHARARPAAAARPTLPAVAESRDGVAMVGGCRERVNA